MCRLADMTYAAPIFVDIEYVHGSHGQTTISAKDNVTIGRMPIMLRSCRCVLHGKDEEELARLGECPLDPGGYFVIKGTEKIPIIIVLKAMGMESDQEIVQMVGRDPRFSASLLPSMEASIMATCFFRLCHFIQPVECISEGVTTRQEALDYLEAKVKKSSYGPPEKVFILYSAIKLLDGKALYILRALFLAHVPVRDNNYRQKCFYVGVMLRRMIEAMLNKDAMDDKDYVGNKRLELSGQLISLLFEDLFKTMTTEAIKKVDGILQKPTRASRFDFSQILDDDGIASPGEIIRPNDVYINKQVPVDTRNNITSQQSDSQYRPAREYFKGPEGETQVVDRVALCSDKNGNLCIKYIIRHTRRPELGDKFSSRHGQKGVCGTIVQQEDFPFSERGICPDLIMNPHGFPSRMTVGKMIELLGSKAGVSSGRFHYGSAFGERSGHADKVEAISKTLVKHGFSYSGKDLLYSGTAL
ncbi:hypothetical protein F2Q68_00035772 [Brassica cretica]|uniref:DNA-directed RNA polymerase n=1 Tax=Brassica cretica TaxID=69181 RepID=A0A8S9H3Z4_BRACR|nr:hypothetical protein F2Q68_00035772 [Brassica cretica]